jgi:hypothetical protein
MAVAYQVRSMDRILVDSERTQLRALFDLEVPGFGVLRRCRYLENADGETFVYGPSALDPRAGGYPVFFEFEPAVRRDVTEIVTSMYRKLFADPQ